MSSKCPVSQEINNYSFVILDYTAVIYFRVYDESSSE